MFKGYIYRHWIVNDKGEEKNYIGQTILKLNRRWNDGDGYKPKQGEEPTHFYNAIKKYGWDNFNHEIIGVVEADTKEQLVLDLDEWEKYYIEKYDSFYNGYNSTTGGSKGYVVSATTREKMSDSHVGKKLSDDTKKKLSEERKGEKNPFYGKKHSSNSKKKMSDTQKGVSKPHSEEHKKSISDAMKELYKDKEKHPMYGKQHSDETKQIIKDKRKKQCGLNASRQRKVICLNTGEVFTLVKYAREWCGCGNTTMNEHLKGNRKTAGKHPETGEKLHWMYYDEYLKLNENSDSNNNKVA